MSDETEPRLRYVALQLCQPCIDGEGQECHTPGCALWLHLVDLPLDEMLIEDVEEIERAAEAKGYRAGIEAAAKVADAYTVRMETAAAKPHPITGVQPNGIAACKADAGRSLAEKIRALPAPPCESQS